MGRSTRSLRAIIYDRVRKNSTTNISNRDNTQGLLTMSSSCNKRDAPTFVAPSNNDELFRLIFAQLSTSTSREEFDEIKPSVEGIVDVNSCQDEQGFQRAVAIVERLLSLRREGFREGFREERRKVSVAALLELDEGDFQLELRGQKGSSVHPKNHDEAEQQEKQFILKDICLKYLNDDERTDIRSVFMQVLKNNDGKFTYYNERDVQSYVDYLLQDAVNTCNEIIKKFWSEAGEDSDSTPVKLDFRLEPDIWSEKPDHAVVFDTRSNAPLVTIEVKKPLPSSSKPLVEFAKVRGQGFDYLNVSKVQGHSWPMHITTTIEESYVAWLPDNDYVERTFNTIGMEEEDTVEEFLTKTIQVIKSSKGENKLTQSPPREEKPTQPALQETPKPAPNYPSKSPIKRLLYTSQSFKRNKLFSVMVNTILCGLHGSTRVAKIPTLETNERVIKTALKLDSYGYEWVNLDAVVRGPLPNPTFLRKFLGSLGFANPRPLYAVSVAGIGSTWKVFRVITSDGYEGVAKIYVKKHDDKKRELPKKEFDCNAKVSVNKELEVFKSVYPDIPVSKAVLHKHQSLLMPFFKPICSEYGTYKDAIKEHLQKLNLKGEHLAYEDEDMCWRHIGLYGKEENIQLFDFNNMREIPQHEVDDQVSKHWTTLKERYKEATNVQDTESV